MIYGINGRIIRPGVMVAWPGSGYGGGSSISYGTVQEIRENGGVLVKVDGSSRTGKPASKHVINRSEIRKVVVIGF